MMHRFALILGYGPAFASASTSSSFYSFWLEWFPYPETRIGNFPLGPGNTTVASTYSDVSNR